jgi:hypothetical protein
VKKAILAIARTLLKTGTAYQDLGADFYTRREPPEQRQAWLERQLRQLHPGCTVTVTVSPRRPPSHPQVTSSLDRQPPEPQPAVPAPRPPAGQPNTTTPLPHRLGQG